MTVGKLNSTTITLAVVGYIVLVAIIGIRIGFVPFSFVERIYSVFLPLIGCSIWALFLFSKEGKRRLSKNKGVLKATVYLFKALILAPACIYIGIWFAGLTNVNVWGSILANNELNKSVEILRSYNGSGRTKRGQRKFVVIEKASLEQISFWVDRSSITVAELDDFNESGAGMNAVVGGYAGPLGYYVDGVEIDKTNGLSPVDIPNEPMAEAAYLLPPGVVRQLNYP